MALIDLTKYLNKTVWVPRESIITKEEKDGKWVVNVIPMPGVAFKIECETEGHADGLVGLFV